MWNKDVQNGRKRGSEAGSGSGVCNQMYALIDKSPGWRLIFTAVFSSPAFSSLIFLLLGEMQPHLSIKCHLIYASFMCRLLWRFIKCPLRCQNMEMEHRYSWFLQQTHQRTGSLVDRVSGGGDGEAGAGHQEGDSVYKWCNSVEDSLTARKPVCGLSPLRRSALFTRRIHAWLVV